VAIDPATGAAEEGALYTYEALPRGTVLWFPVRYQNPGNFLIGKQQITLSWGEMQEKVEAGLRLMEILGVGGKGSRGMGRLKCL
jgi:CRISPR-associated protein Cmr4